MEKMENREVYRVLGSMLACNVDDPQVKVDKLNQFLQTIEPDDYIVEPYDEVIASVDNVLEEVVTDGLQEVYDKLSKINRNNKYFYSKRNSGEYRDLALEDVDIVIGEIIKLVMESL